MNLGEKYFDLFFNGNIFSEIKKMQGEDKTKDITRVEASIMYILYKYDSKKMGEIASMTNLPNSTANFLVKKLEKKEFLCTRRSDEDNRVVMVDLTNKGTKVAKEIINASNDMLTVLFEKAYAKLDEKMKPEELNIVKKAVKLLSE